MNKLELTVCEAQVFKYLSCRWDQRFHRFIPAFDANAPKVAAYSTKNGVTVGIFEVLCVVDISTRNLPVYVSKDIINNLTAGAKKMGVSAFLVVRFGDRVKYKDIAKLKMIESEDASAASFRPNDLWDIGSISELNMMQRMECGKIVVPEIQPKLPGIDAVPV